MTSSYIMYMYRKLLNSNQHIKALEHIYTYMYIYDYECMNYSMKSDRKNVKIDKILHTNDIVFFTRLLLLLSVYNISPAELDVNPSSLIQLLASSRIYICIFMK